MFSRRDLLTTTGLTIVGGALIPRRAKASGSNPTATNIAQDVVNEVGDFSNGVLTLATEIQGVPAATLTEIQTDAGEIKSLSSDISTTMTQQLGLPVVQQIGNYFTVVANDVKQYIQPNSTLATILSDLEIVLPLIEAGVGLLGKQAATPVSADSQAAAKARLAQLPRVTKPLKVVR
jgi:hypothetical protein